VSTPILARAVPARKAWTVAEAAAATGFSEKTIRRAIWRGDLQASRLPRVDGRGVLRITDRALEAWLERGDS
jgi:excisionase family DNA binding protein